MNYLLSIVITGIVATAVMDVWGIARKPLLNIAPPDYRLVGRWLGHMRHGQFRHQAIAGSPAVKGEMQIGWIVHYLIGIIFAAALIGGWGLEWVERPTLGPALIVGIATVAAPFLLMQPGMGAGTFASKTPRPNATRIQSLITHTMFGLGLYVGGWLTHMVYSL